MSSPKKTTSTGAEAKLNRAINQLENVEALIRGMPKKIYKTKRYNIEQIAQEVYQLSLRIEKELLSEYTMQNSQIQTKKNLPELR